MDFVFISMVILKRNALGIKQLNYIFCFKFFQSKEAREEQPLNPRDDAVCKKCQTIEGRHDGVQHDDLRHGRIT